MLPGFFLTFLYLLYILGWAVINPKIAPKLPPDQYRVAIPEWLGRLEAGRWRSVVPGVVAAAALPGRLRGAVAYATIANRLFVLLVPLLLTVGTFGATWWYVVVYNAPEAATAAAPPRAAAPTAAPAPAPAAPPAAARPAAEAEAPQELGAAGGDAGAPQELGATGDSETAGAPAKPDGPPEEMTSLREPTTRDQRQVPEHFYPWFWGLAAAFALLLAVYYVRMDGEQLEILRELCASVVPLGVLTVVVLGVILFGISTATESAAIGALGAMYLAVMAKYQRQVLWWSLIGFVLGVALGWYEGEAYMSLLVAGSIAGTLLGTVVPGLWHLRTSPELRTNLKQSTFLTAKTTAMVCWLFVGSALFSAVFALHGGQGLIERWVLSMNLSPLGFTIVAQLIIFLLGWPLEWTEIIVIFCPIFIPLLSHFQIDPILFGTMVAVNLQAAFLSPPVAMSAFYLKGVSPKHVTLNQIFAGMMPYMIIVCICLVFMHLWPGMTLWLPEFLYGK
jgi:TRAP-type mannitol/chloroaromatic compound transport system permease large subunit